MAMDYSAKIRQEVDKRLERLCSWFPYDIFYVELDFNYISPHTTLEAIHRSVIFSRDLFLSQDYGPRMVVSMFANTGAPQDFLPTFIQDILAFAWEADGDSVNLGRKVIKLMVEVIVLVPEDDEDDDDDYDRVIDESLRKLDFKPASRSAIESLKRVRLGDDDDGILLPLKKRRRMDSLSSSKKQCTICLDEFSDREEVVLMPCGHVFHDGCIVRWLETSHLCPLCRYRMPC